MNAKFATLKTRRKLGQAYVRKVSSSVPGDREKNRQIAGRAR